ncbi:putative DNA-binding mobile mystery protein A [Flavobacterium sp. 1]|uniref:mobile mystery protein A n=1 Tax=Flavobacterium sp. 1 TaxID=2035200 RepID=UPI000C24219A|nr:mobile mystery protein A [Flavobacterium sp. 1]PJJ06996.1 putative DNA-binding mobile mystery protein A [Flavobacterium sp. 1]
MKNVKQQLILDQTDRKLIPFRLLQTVIVPPKGWINTFRTALKMSLRQLGNRMNFSAQNIKQMEEREVNGTISINSLQQVALALDMKLVYGFVSQHESLEQMIEKRANEIAREIVMRTNVSMKLEDQQNSEERIKKAIAQKTVEIKNEMPKYLWD